MIVIQWQPVKMYRFVIDRVTAERVRFCLRMRPAKRWATILAMVAIVSALRLRAEVASSPLVDPYGLPMVRAACGKEGVGAESFPKSSAVETPQETGRTRIYVVTESWKFIGRAGDPVVLGIDGRWFAANRGRHFSFSFVDVEPGIHHLCVAAHVSGVLPNSSAAVALVQVNAKAGQAYYFYNRCVNLMHILTLVPINRETGQMYVEAIPPARGDIPKLWSTEAARQACGLDPRDMSAGSPPPPTLPGPPSQGMALIYFYSSTLQLSGRRAPTRLAIDGRRSADVRDNSYGTVEVKPGDHQMCSQSKSIFAGTYRTLWLGGIHVEAGNTYFVDMDTLQQESDNLATLWLKRIAAMPKSTGPAPKALTRWGASQFPFVEDEIHACDIPPDGAPFNNLRTWDASPATGPRITLFLLSGVKRLRARNAVNITLDKKWVASLMRSSWVAFPVAPGVHLICSHLTSGGSFTAPVLGNGDALVIGSLRVPNENKTLYFGTQLVVIQLEYSTIYELMSQRIDPDEGALLTAFYPQASAAQY